MKLDHLHIKGIGITCSSLPAFRLTDRIWGPLEYSRSDYEEPMASYSSKSNRNGLLDPEGLEPTNHELGIEARGRWLLVAFYRELYSSTYGCSPAFR